MEIEKNTENMELIRNAQSGDRNAMEKLISQNMGLVKNVAKRFLGRNTEYEDLVQIGTIGMLKAAKSFDLEFGTAFSTYAVPLIIGEIRRFLRDDGMIKVSRTYRRIGVALMNARNRICAEEGRDPTIAELAELCGVTPEEAAIALDATSPVSSLSETVYGEVKVTGIIRPKKDVDSTMLSSGIGYTYYLTKHVIERAVDSDVVQAQLASPTVDVLTGLPFQSNTGTMSDAEKEAAFRAYIGGLSQAGKAEAFVSIQSVKAVEEQLQAQTDAWMATFTDKDSIVKMIAQIVAANMGTTADQMESAFANLAKDMTLDELKALVRPYAEEIVKAQIQQSVAQALASIPMEQKAAALDMQMATFTTEDCALYYDEVTVFSDNTYDGNLAMLGHLDYASPSTINIYSSSFENKDVIAQAIKDYNKTVPKEQQISYTDYMSLLMSSVTSIVDAVTYVLIAFVAISLVVSSIMIGVITLISVQERTKEIGILRAIGASKRDVSSMFNAETLIIGFASGLLGVLVTYLLCIPINIILYALTGIATLQAVLPISAAIILVLISMGLTLISGIIPSRSAAKKDPVVALRTE